LAWFQLPLIEVTCHLWQLARLLSKFDNAACGA
jgi:hypothetical protein